MSADWRVPFILRGVVIDRCDLEFSGRAGEVSYRAPDAASYLDALTLPSAADLSDLHAIGHETILDFLEALGRRLHLAHNEHLSNAFELARRTSSLSSSTLRNEYEKLPGLFERRVLTAMVEGQIEQEYLDGWVGQPRSAGCSGRVWIRAFGARSVHIIPGNSPSLAALSIIRNALVRSDALIKTPSNDPLTAGAIARTMVEMAPTHPVTRHLAVAHWKGGNATVEAAVLDPRRVEKVVAWGGFESIRHISRYLRAGLELITFDPKLSKSIIGPEAFRDEATLRDVAARLARDVGALDQEACFNSRVAYVVCGQGAEALSRARKLGLATFEAMQALPPSMSNAPRYGDAELRMEIDALRISGTGFDVFGGRANECAVIVSPAGEAVEFAGALRGRVCNLVPVERVEEALACVGGDAQTVGIYPESLKLSLRDALAVRGVQRVVSLGSAATFVSPGSPQDAMEPLRRLCRWVVDEVADVVEAADAGKA